MGIEIVKAAVVYGNRLSGNAYKVLVAMSLSALDKPSNGRPASLYWGGWDGLAIVLGHSGAERNSTGHTLVKRAVKELREANHITPLLEAHRGVAQSYMVHPGGMGKGEQKVPVKGEQSVPVKGVQKVPQRGNKKYPPRSNEGPTGLTQDISIAHEPQVQTARPKAESAHKFLGRPGDDCEACGRGYGNRTIHPLYMLRGGGA